MPQKDFLIWTQITTSITFKLLDTFQSWLLRIIRLPLSRLLYSVTSMTIASPLTSVATFFLSLLPVWLSVLSWSLFFFQFFLLYLIYSVLSFLQYSKLPQLHTYILFFHIILHHVPSQVIRYRSLGYTADPLVFKCWSQSLFNPRPSPHFTVYFHVILRSYLYNLYLQSIQFF